MDVPWGRPSSLTGLRSSSAGKPALGPFRFHSQNTDLCTSDSVTPVSCSVLSAPSAWCLLSASRISLLSANDLICSQGVVCFSELVFWVPGVAGSSAQRWERPSWLGSWFPNLVLVLSQFLQLKLLYKALKTFSQSHNTQVTRSSSQKGLPGAAVGRRGDLSPFISCSSPAWPRAPPLPGPSLPQTRPSPSTYSWDDFGQTTHASCCLHLLKGVQELPHPASGGLSETLNPQPAPGPSACGPSD